MDIRKILDIPSLYAAWQAPFVTQKISPFLENNALPRGQRILEIGCGPGTNAKLFQQCEYVGIDLNPAYISSAQRRFRGTFLCADAASFELTDQPPFDAVFINSLFHHLNDQQVMATLETSSKLLKPEGSLHLLDLVLPEQASVARFLAKADRGDYPRPLPVWKSLLEQHFRTDLLKPYAVKCLAISCWQMFYFRGQVIG